MAEDFTIRSATGTVVEKLTFTHIEVTGTADNVDDEDAPIERRYYILAKNDAGDYDNLRSYAFAPSQDGKHTWDNVLFPVAGAWTLELHDMSDDSVVASEALTVVAP